MPWDCSVCGKVLRVMKRCTRCSMKYYCSRECQILDWKSHKEICTPLSQSDKTIKQTSSTECDTDLLTASSRETEARRTGPGFSYLNNDQVFFDVPTIQESKTICYVFIRHSKIKDKICLHPFWTGTEIFKYLSSALCIPYDNLQLIHKGKKLKEETVNICIYPKSVFLALGDTALSEDNINGQDLVALMKQLNVNRNTAIKALEKNGNLIDAILDLSG